EQGGRSQQRHGRELRGIQPRPRCGVAGASQLRQYRLRLPRRRPAGDGPHRRPGARARGGDRGAPRLRRPLRLRTARSADHPRRGPQRDDLSGRGAGGLLPRGGGAAPARQDPRRALQSDGARRGAGAGRGRGGGRVRSRADLRRPARLGARMGRREGRAPLRARGIRRSRLQRRWHPRRAQPAGRDPHRSQYCGPASGRHGHHRAGDGDRRDRDRAGDRHPLPARRHAGRAAARGGRPRGAARRGRGDPPAASDRAL
ncbi:MAG: Lactam utilization protein LamB, partial [uncultured Thermomicrobiales bacterium]